MQRIKTYKEYKKYAIKKLIEKEKEFSFDKIDDRFHYIYRISNLLENKHYYGSRSSDSLDIGIEYFTSSKDLKFKEDFKTNPKNYKIKIVKIFNNKWDKQFYEAFLHQFFNVKLHNKFYNKNNQTPTGRDTTGMVSCIDKDGNPLQVSKEEFDSRDDLFGVNKDMIRAKDKNDTYIFINKELFKADNNLVGVQKNFVNCMDLKGNKIRINKDEYDRNIHIHYSKGMVSCIDKDGNKLSVTKEEFDSSDDLVHVSKGLVSCIDENGNYLKVTKEEFDSKDDLFGVNKGKINNDSNPSAKRINIYNEKDELMFECHGNFEKICKENNLPHQALYKSYKKGGTLYTTKMSLLIAKRFNYLQYQGWYAIDKGYLRELNK